MGFLPKDRDLTEPVERVELTVDASDFRVKARDLVMRLDQFLAEHLRWRSRTSIQELIRGGHVHVDAATPEHPQGCGELECERRPGRKLRHGSRVVIVVPEEQRQTVHVGQMGPLSILYEDEDVVALDKPPLVAVHPSGRHVTDTLIQRVHAHFKAEVEAGRMTPRLCHRLDRETSGIVLVAKRAATHPRLALQFEDREVAKTYLAIVWGRVEPQAFSITDPIGPSRASDVRLKMAVRADGLPSRTDVEVVERLGRYTLVSCRLLTGRQHQIRLHLSARGYPIVGDKLYGPDPGCFVRAAEERLTPDDLRRLELERHALHHHRLRFTTPVGGREVEVESPLAADLSDFLSARASQSRHPLEDQDERQ